MTTIYMPLLNEGTGVWRPVAAEELGGARYRVAEHASDDEEWAFATGVIVVVDRDRRIVAEVAPDDRYGPVSSKASRRHAS